jgi:hypothetical protein
MKVTAAITVMVAFCSGNCFGVETSMLKNKNISMHIESIDVSQSNVRIDYSLINSKTDVVYIAIDNPDSSIANWIKIPFIRLDKKNDILELESYIAPLPVGQRIETPYLHPVARLYPGETKRHLRLALPLHANAPYSSTSSEALNLNKIRAIRLRLGYIACDQTAAAIEHIREKPGFEYVSGVTTIDCDGRKATLLELQAFVESEKVVIRK